MSVSIETRSTFRAGKPTLLFEGPFHGPALDAGPHYDVAPDGERFVMVQEPPATEIHVVMN
jgi:hypothetical protein